MSWMAMNYRGCRLQIVQSVDVQKCPMRSNIFKYSNPGYVERSWRCFETILAQRPGVSCECICERDSNSFFPQNYLFIWTKTIQLCLSSSMLSAFLTLSFPSTVALGLNFECSFSCKVSHVQSLIIYGKDPCSLANDTVVCSSSFPYTQN